MPSQPSLSVAMLTALGEMPIKLRQHVIGGPWCMPSFGPHSGTVKALERRGLVEYDDDSRQWRRTPLGEQAWYAR